MSEPLRDGEELVRRWWGRAWLAALDTSAPADARRAQQGAALFRRGAVHDLQIAPGRVTGHVVTDRAGDVEVTAEVAPLTDDEWEVVTHLVADRLRFTAGLLNGFLPVELAARLEERGIALLPGPGALRPSCTADGRGACPHVVAVHRAAAVRIDRDPSLLLWLRGRPQHRVLSDVRAARGADDDVDAEVVDLGDGALDVARGDVSQITVHPERSRDPAWLVRHLPPPPYLDDVEPLTGLFERAAEAAWRLAAGDGAAGADTELLLAELRARRTAGVQALADALGRDPDEVRDELDGLYEDGAVLRTGSGDRARYRAVDV